MNEFNFENMCALDIEDIVQIEKLTFGSHSWSEQLFYSELNDPIKHYIVLKENNFVIAYGGYAQIHDEGHIMNLAVDQSYRGMGIGKALVLELISRMKNSSITCATLEVNENNINAIKLYEKLGFELAGKRYNYYAKGESALIYWLYFE
ncbi:MAG: ribosomal protein S18-alanine N-acetyltransferase [Christensenellaceae bacterium]|jgi:ribosomal-protein-alanine N-acetyltransferase|nr:ribosomal protein S18-alanine N-acetyltransferase [Christensenellaceae bacterium]